MPSKSDKQRRFLEHKFGHGWVKRHHFDKVKNSTKRRRKRRPASAHGSVQLRSRRHPASPRFSSREVPKHLTLEGSVDFRASKAGPYSGKMLLLANTGKPMHLEGFPLDVVVNMEGHRFARETSPIIGDHQTNNRIGHSIEQVTIAARESAKVGNQTIKGPAIAVMGVRSSETKYAKEIESDMRAGYPFQVSIGTDIDDYYILEEGESDVVNGRTVRGPMIVADKSTTREVTVTVIGADSDTSATIAARAKLGEPAMLKSWKVWLQAMGHSDERKLAPKVRRTLKAQYDAYVKAEEGDDEDDDEDDDSPRRSGGGTATLPKKVKAKGKTKIRASQDPESEGDEDDDDDDEADAGGSERHSKRIKASSVRNLYADEDERVSSINNLVTELGENLAETEFEVPGAKGKKIKLNFSRFKAHAIRTGMSASDFELQCRRASYYTGGGEEGRAPSIHVKSGQYDSRCVEIGLMRAAGVTQSGSRRDHTGKEHRFGFEHLYDPEVMEAADDPRYQLTGSINELLDLSIRANGHYPLARSGTALFDQAFDVWNKLGGPRITPERIRASGFSTLYLTNILENVANKTASVSFQAADGTWREWVGRRNLQDFKPAAIYTLDLDGSFKKVAPDGELKHITMRDTKRTIQAETYGAMITIDRKTRIDDDMGLVIAKASSLGTLAAVRIEESVYVLLLSNAGSFFAVGNGNILSGAGSALGIDAVTLAQQKFQFQTLYGKQIVVTPQILLTGITLGPRATNIYKIDKPTLGYGDTTTTTLFTNNPHVGRYRPVVTPWIDNTALRDQDGNAISGQSATQSYLLAAANTPQGSVMELGFLNGRETPYFDQAETQFNVPGGIQMRSFLDWGVAFGLTQLGVKLVGV